MYEADNNAKMTPPAKESFYRTTNERIEKEFGCIVAQLDLLETKLALVLANEAPETEGLNTVEAGPQTGLDKDVYRTLNMLQTQNKRLSKLINRISL